MKLLLNFRWLLFFIFLALCFLDTYGRGRGRGGGGRGHGGHRSGGHRSGGSSHGSGGSSHASGGDSHGSSSSSHGSGGSSHGSEGSSQGSGSSSLGSSNSNLGSTHGTGGHSHSSHDTGSHGHGSNNSSSNGSDDSEHDNDMDSNDHHNSRYRTRRPNLNSVTTTSTTPKPFFTFKKPKITLPKFEEPHHKKLFKFDMLDLRIFGTNTTTTAKPAMSFEIPDFNLPNLYRSEPKYKSSLKLQVPSIPVNPSSTKRKQSQLDLPVKPMKNFVNKDRQYVYNSNLTPQGKSNVEYLKNIENFGEQKYLHSEKKQALLNDVQQSYSPDD